MVAAQWRDVQWPPSDGVAPLDADVPEESWERPCSDLSWVRRDTGDLVVIATCEYTKGPVLLLQVDRKVAHCEQTHFGNHLVIRGVKAEGVVCLKFPIIPESDGNPGRNRGNERPLEECETVQIIMGSENISIQEDLTSHRSIGGVCCHQACCATEIRETTELQSKSGDSRNREVVLHCPVYGSAWVKSSPEIGADLLCFVPLEGGPLL